MADIGELTTLVTELEPEHDGAKHVTKMTGKRALLEQLVADGVRHIFGNPGTTEQAFQDLLQEFPRHHLRAVSARRGGGQHGRRLRPGHRTARLRPAAHRTGPRQRDGHALQRACLPFTAGGLRRAERHRGAVPGTVAQRGPRRDGGPGLQVGGADRPRGRHPAGGAPRHGHCRRAAARPNGPGDPDRRHGGDRGRRHPADGVHAMGGASGSRRARRGGRRCLRPPAVRWWCSATVSR